MSLQVTEQMLGGFGVTTVADLHVHRAVLAHVFSPISCDFFLHASLGLGSTLTPEKAAEGDVTRKGISTERTFAAISQKEDLHKKLSELAGSLSEDMAEEQIKGKCVTLKLKESNFHVRANTSSTAPGVACRPHHAQSGLCNRDCIECVLLLAWHSSSFSCHFQLCHDLCRCGLAPSRCRHTSRPRRALRRLRCGCLLQSCQSRFG
jgi:impB/mucB/samB family C-terminal domain